MKFWLIVSSRLQTVILYWMTGSMKLRRVLIPISIIPKTMI